MGKAEAEAADRGSDVIARDEPASAARGPDAAAVLHRALSAALEVPDGTLDRLPYARTSIAIRVSGAATGVTLLLDRAKPVATPAVEPAEIELELTGEQALRFARGELPMPAAVATGSVIARGPVRKYLEVDVILRERLGSLIGGPCDVVRPAGADGAIEPSLLAVETRGLHKSFGTNSVLAGLDLEVPEGVISAVLGPSGTGKSVLLQHIIGVMQPDAGDVVIRGRSLSAMSRSELLLQRREIGVMFQDGALFSSLDVFDNVAYPLRQHTDLSEREIRENVERHLADVGLLRAAHRMPGELSGGMRKRAGLARALALDPGIVLCDEPDSGLDPVRTALLGDLLVERHAEHGGAMVVVTHNIALARSIADHVSIVFRGRVVESGFIDAVLGSDDDFVRQFLSGDSQGPLGMDA